MEDIAAMLQSLMGGAPIDETSDDPRIMALRGMTGRNMNAYQQNQGMPPSLARRGGPVEDDRHTFAGRPYTTPSVPYRMEPATNTTTEDDLQRVYDQMDYGAGVTDPDEWPETVEEFVNKFGREPATDSEMDFYYGEGGDEYSKGTMLRSGMRRNPEVTSEDDEDAEEQDMDTRRR